MMFAGCSDFVAVGVLVAAGSLGHLLGGTVGIFVGLFVGLALFIAALAAIAWTEKEVLVCEYAVCHRQFAYRECPRRSAHEG